MPKVRFVLAVVAAVAGLSAAAVAADRKPAVTFDSFFRMQFYPRGALMRETVDVAFAPADPSGLEFRIRRADGTVVVVGPYADTYRNTAAVFGRATTREPRIMEFGKGDFVAEYVYGGEVITQHPFTVAVKSTSDDPFNPGETLKYVGPWQEWAYLQFSPDSKSAALHFWAGVSDMPTGRRNDYVNVEVTRGGTLVAKSKKASGRLGRKPMQKLKVQLHQPHDDARSVNVPDFTLDDFSADGVYEVAVKFTETGETIRRFQFSVDGGAITPHPRTVLGYEPHADYIPPRIFKSGGYGYEFDDVVWIARP